MRLICTLFLTRISHIIAYLLTHLYGVFASRTATYVAAWHDALRCNVPSMRAVFDESVSVGRSYCIMAWSDASYDASEGILVRALWALTKTSRVYTRRSKYPYAPHTGQHGKAMLRGSRLCRAAKYPLGYSASPPTYALFFCARCSTVYTVVTCMMHWYEAVFVVSMHPVCLSIRCAYLLQVDTTHRRWCLLSHVGVLWDKGRVTPEITSWFSRVKAALSSLSSIIRTCCKTGRQRKDRSVILCFVLHAPAPAPLAFAGAVYIVFCACTERE